MDAISLTWYLIASEEHLPGPVSRYPREAESVVSPTHRKKPRVVTIASASFRNVYHYTLTANLWLSIPLRTLTDESFASQRAPRQKAANANPSDVCL
jgi:hypothetical protein